MKWRIDTILLDGLDPLIVVLEIDLLVSVSKLHYHLSRDATWMRCISAIFLAIFTDISGERISGAVIGYAQRKRRKVRRIHRATIRGDHQGTF